MARELCGKLGPVDLRARASIATMQGWVPLHAGEHDLYRPAALAAADPGDAAARS